MLKYEEYFDLLTVARPADEEFRWSVQQLRELYAERRTGEVITASMEVLTRGITEGTGTRRRELRGHTDARAFLLSGLAGIERELSAASAPEGDMRAEGREIKEDYVRRELQRAPGPRSPPGSPRWTRCSAAVSSAASSTWWPGTPAAGKTSFAAQLAWHAVTQQGRNVVIFTSETLRGQVRFKILARHSAGWRSSAWTTGINTRDMKAGTLNDKNAFAAVLHDFASNDAYGHCHVAQVPRGATVSTLESRLARLAREWTADLVIVDSLALLRPEVRHRDLRESLVEILQEGKQVAATYQDGLGVPVLSPVADPAGGPR